MDNDTSESFQKAAFYVDYRIDKSVIKKAPTDGHEYIQQVVFEASQLEQVVTVPICESKKLQNSLQGEFSDVLQWNELSKVSYPDDFSLSLAQKIRVLMAFYDAKKKILRRVEENKSKILRSLNKKTAPTELEKWTSFVAHNAPSMHYFAAASQCTLDRYLEVHVEFLGEKLMGNMSHSIVSNSLNWIYYMLVFCRIPLVPETCAMLRDIAKLLVRFCSIHRSTVNRNTNKDVNIQLISGAKIIICIISNYFQQTDLDKFC